MKVSLVDVDLYKERFVSLDDICQDTGLKPSSFKQSEYRTLNGLIAVLNLRRMESFDESGSESHQLGEKYVFSKNSKIYLTKECGISESL